MTIPSGTKLGRYEIREQLGAGGMGDVYLAEDAELGRKVAVKFLSATAAADERAHKRLIREARAAARLDHPNICSVYEVGEKDGQTFIVMQYVEGETLHSRMKHQTLDLSSSLSIATQVADALAEAHGHGIIHRDIKPGNIIITRRGQAKVMDFGLAKIVSPSDMDQRDAETERLLTTPGMILGTVPYMSPEQVKGEVVDARSDIFSFGVVLYEMLSGRQPFARQSVAQTISAILTDDPPTLLRSVSDAPEELQRIMQKCLEKDCERRYQTMRDLQIDLENLRRRREAGTRSDDGQARRSGASAGAVAPRRHKIFTSWRALSLATVILVVAGLGFRLLWNRAPAGLHPEIKSLAVLPLENFSGDPAQDYFADGMTEALIYNLAQISALRVISRTSVMQYKQAKKPLPQIARELNVDAIIEGSVLRSGGKIQITAELIQATPEKHLWAMRYERNLREVLAVQNEVARAVVEEIRVKLTAQEESRLKESRTVNPEAHDAYLRGRYWLNKGERDDLAKARQYFEQSLASDPKYAPAYAGLADYYSVLPFYTSARPDETFPRAKEAVAKALELDYSLAEAHGSLAYIQTYYDWDWSAAESEFQRSLALNPNDATVRHRYSRYLSSLGRTEEALSEIRRAQELDPLSLVIKANIGVVYYFGRQYDQASEQLVRVVQENPEFSVGHWGLGLAYEQKGMGAESLAEFEKAAALTGRGTNSIASLGHAYASLGRTREARKVLDELRNRAKGSKISGYQIALVCVGLGEKDQALQALDEAFREHSTLLTYLKMDPRFDPLRSDLRFQELLRRVGLQ